MAKCSMDNGFREYVELMIAVFDPARFAAIAGKGFEFDIGGDFSKKMAEWEAKAASVVSSHDGVFPVDPLAADEMDAVRSRVAAKASAYGVSPESVAAMNQATGDIDRFVMAAMLLRVATTEGPAVDAKVVVADVKAGEQLVLYFANMVAVADSRIHVFGGGEVAREVTAATNRLAETGAATVTTSQLAEIVPVGKLDAAIDYMVATNLIRPNLAVSGTWDVRPDLAAIIEQRRREAGTTGDLGKYIRVVDSE